MQQLLFQQYHNHSVNSATTTLSTVPQPLFQQCNNFSFSSITTTLSTVPQLLYQQCPNHSFSRATITQSTVQQKLFQQCHNHSLSSAQTTLSAVPKPLFKQSKNHSVNSTTKTLSAVPQPQPIPKIKKIHFTQSFVYALSLQIAIFKSLQTENKNGCLSLEQFRSRTNFGISWFKSIDRSEGGVWRSTVIRANQRSRTEGANH